MKLLILALSISSLFGQATINAPAVTLTPAVAFSTPAPPVITPVDMAKFWHALAVLSELVPKYQTAEAAVRSIRAELENQCGDKHQLTSDGTHVLKCVPKPEPKEPKK